LTVETPPGNTEESGGYGLGLSIVSFIPTLDAFINVDTEGFGNAIITSDSSATVIAP
jgi:hypothetical protein